MNNHERFAVMLEQFDDIASYIKQLDDDLAAFWEATKAGDDVSDVAAQMRGYADALAKDAAELVAMCSEIVDD